MKQDAQIAGELRSAYSLLRKADPIYHGHRAAGINELKKALDEMDREMKKHVKMPKTPQARNLVPEGDELLVGQ
jgi:hypothetical protein